MNYFGIPNELTWQPQTFWALECKKNKIEVSLSLFFKLNFFWIQQLLNYFFTSFFILVMSTKLLNFFFVLVYLLSLIHASVIVNTVYGNVEGVFEDSVYKFRSIPYAKAPVGSLRWENPVPPERM